MNFYIVIGVIALYATTTAAVAFRAFEAGEDHAKVSQAHTEELMAQAADNAASSAAGLIAQIKPVSTVIRQEVQHDVQTHTFYQSCQHDAAQLVRLNAALDGRAVGADAAASSVVPQAGAAR